VGFPLLRAFGEELFRAGLSAMNNRHLVAVVAIIGDERRLQPGESIHKRFEVANRVAQPSALSLCTAMTQFKGAL
jgi:hypothetical protein